MVFIGCVKWFMPNADDFRFSTSDYKFFLPFECVYFCKLIVITLEIVGL